MSRKTAILDGNDVVRRNHLRRLAEGPDGIAHLVPADDGSERARRQLVEDVSAIGRKNHAAAIRANRSKTRAGGKA
jgi:hypothetical protein